MRYALQNPTMLPISAIKTALQRIWLSMEMPGSRKATAMIRPVAAGSTIIAITSITPAA